ncbi:hypothetical protein CC86DRAFT_459648 [Ophiobolus disseminans]|uniref:MARVEL domain-containing protein n=1 Tax=Ophiobolus disseminans TaxID=1469910 RepID=A0A6A6ZIJ3_9PLEO|nr:hypothetical protein CC86DRAFT_459648 [Ophiobolus disseminans]
MASHANADYGAPTARSNKMHRPLLTATHALHLISSFIVMGIAAYLLKHDGRNTHLICWVTIAAISTFLALLALLALILPAMKSYKGYFAPLDWAFSYLWLTAFIFAAQDYRNSVCRLRFRGSLDCSLIKTIVAFTFLAFLTSLIGAILEIRLFDVQRYKRAPTAGSAIGDKTPAVTTAQPSGTVI